MKKSDLKTGMLVEYRNGNVGLVINEYILGVGIGVWCDLESLRSDLIMSEGNSNRYDIMKVSNVLKKHQLNPSQWTKETLMINLLWERKEVPEYTIEELTEKLGHEFKIKK